MKHSKIGMSLALVFSALAVSASAQSSQPHWSSTDGTMWKSADECVRGGFTDAGSKDCAAPVIIDTPKPPPPVVGAIPANLLFAFNSAEIKPEGFDAIAAIIGPALSAIKSAAGANPVNISVVGHTDNIGSHAFNQRLSERRAESVKKYLVSRGVPADAIVTEGKSFDQPVAPNTTAEGRALNRRVDLKLTINAAGAIDAGKNLLNK